MEQYKIQVKYNRNDSEPKEIELEFDKYPAAFIIDSFVLESVMKHEEPDLVSIYPLIQSVPRGAPATRMPNNQELMKMHGITNLIYEIDGRAFCIST